MSSRPVDCDELPTIELLLPHDPATVPAARDSVARIVAYAAEPLVDRVSLTVSELVTNAVVHGDGPFSLRASCKGGHLSLEVYDPAPGLPAPVDPDVEDLSGRGLHLVEVVADRWGTTPKGSGKSVWATFDGQHREPPSDG